MNKEMKLNAVKNLIQSLDFSREEKEALLLVLQQELGMDAKPEQSAGIRTASAHAGHV